MRNSTPATQVTLHQPASFLPPLFHGSLTHCPLHSRDWNEYEALEVCLTPTTHMQVLGMSWVAIRLEPYILSGLS